MVICAKKRDGNKRSVVVSDGLPQGQEVLIVDDLVRSGGTLVKCGEALRAAGATRFATMNKRKSHAHASTCCTPDSPLVICSVCAFVAHAVFPNQAWKKFAKGGEFAGVFDKLLVTNSCPTIVDALPADDCFVVLDLSTQIVKDLTMA